MSCSVYSEAAEPVHPYTTIVSIIITALCRTIIIPNDFIITNHTEVQVYKLVSPA